MTKRAAQRRAPRCPQIVDVSVDQRLDRPRVSSQQLGDVAHGEAGAEQGECRCDGLGAGHASPASAFLASSMAENELATHREGDVGQSSRPRAP